MTETIDVKSSDLMQTSEQKRGPLSNNDCALIENILTGNTEVAHVGELKLNVGPDNVLPVYQEQAEVLRTPLNVLKGLKSSEDVNKEREGTVISLGLTPLFGDALGHLMIRGLTPVMSLGSLDENGKVDSLRVAFAKITREATLNNGIGSSKEVIDIRPSEEWKDLELQPAGGYGEMFDDAVVDGNALVLSFKTPTQP